MEAVNFDLIPEEIRENIRAFTQEDPHVRALAYIMGFQGRTMTNRELSNSLKEIADALPEVKPVPRPTDLKKVLKKYALLESFGHGVGLLGTVSPFVLWVGSKQDSALLNEMGTGPCRISSIVRES